MFGFLRKPHSCELLSSQLFSHKDFYRAFSRDIKRAEREIVIESPFLACKRLASLSPLLETAIQRNVKVVINTKPLEEQADEYLNQAASCLNLLQVIGATVYFTGGHHRKLAIIDRKILYEGSLNILSQNDSCEIMRRLVSDVLAHQMLVFTGMKKFI